MQSAELHSVTLDEIILHELQRSSVPLFVSLYAFRLLNAIAGQTMLAHSSKTVLSDQY